VIRTLGVEAWKKPRMSALDHMDAFRLQPGTDPARSTLRSLTTRRRPANQTLTGVGGCHAQEMRDEMDEEADRFNLRHQISEFDHPPLPADFDPGRKFLTARDVFVLRKYGRQEWETGDTLQHYKEYLRLSDAVREELMEEAEAINRCDTRPGSDCTSA
jgi:D-tyrosyl-tRNA(Tyr) deacylase